MAKFTQAIPELGVLPPSTAGDAPIPTKLHGLRARQLLDLVTAFGIELPPPRNKVNYTKTELLTYLQPHEEQGTFRQPPQSKYHLLHAQLNHDVRGEEHQREMEALQRDLVRAEHDEFPLDGKARAAYAAEHDPNSLFYWKQEAKKRGLKGTMGKGREELQAMVKAFDDAVARSVEAASEKPA